MTGGDYRRSELHSVIEVARNRHRPPRLLTGFETLKAGASEAAVRYDEDIHPTGDPSEWSYTGRS